MTTKIYVARDEGGSEERLEAADMDAAVELAEAWCRDGDWGEDGASVSVGVTEYDADGEETDHRRITVEIDPDHAALIRRACGGRWSSASERCCGADPNKHDWTSEGEGGCRENPGVWSVGGTAMLFADHCRVCGLRRRSHACGSQRNPGEHDTVEYDMPKSWCAGCQQEECDCERRP